MKFGKMNVQVDADAEDGDPEEAVAAAASLLSGNTMVMMKNLSKWKKCSTMSRREKVKREALKENINMDEESSEPSESTVEELPEPQYLDEDVEQRNMTAKFLEVFNGKEGPEARMIRLTLTQKIVAMVQMTLCVVTFIFAILSSIRVKTGENTFSDIFCGLIGFFSSIIGFYSGKCVSEFLARLYFVCQIWTLNVLTLYLYIVTEDEAQQKAQCEPSYGEYVSVSSCASALSEAQAKLSFAVLLCVIVVVGASVTLDFNDAINDYDALRPMLHAHQTAALTVNVEHPNHLSYLKPMDRRAGAKWHLKFENAKTAPDIEKSFLAVKGN